MLKKRLECPEVVAIEIADLRKALRMPNEKLLLLVSIATDDMVRLVVMHPEVWFLDCTSGTNKQKRDLFMMAIRTPTGATFPGNLTIIPSGKRWIFLCIYQLAFIALYGELTCSRNRLSLCDEDDSEYGPFENCIATVPQFKLTILMLCVFHAVWQPFKKEVFPFLPRKSKGSPILSDTGKVWGNFFYASFIRQCSTYTTKEMYDRSQRMLSNMLEEQATVDAVGVRCVEAVKGLQNKLKGKERYLAYYLRVGIYMCLDAQTTSPVESMNELTKHGPRAVDSNMNISRSLITMTEGHDDRYHDYRNEQIRELSKTTRASATHTKKDIQRKCQYVIDKNFDDRKTVKTVMCSSEEWNAWEFLDNDCIEDECKSGPWTRLARFHEVHTLRLKRLGGRDFLWCSCLYYNR